MDLSIQLNHIKYNVGDIIDALIRDYDYTGKYFYQYVKGKILAVHQINNIIGYDVKLSNPIYFEYYIPYPFSEDLKNICTVEIKDPLLISVKNRYILLNIIFINQIDVIRHCPSHILDNINFTSALKSLWSNIIFRKVKTVIRNNKDLLSIEYLNMDNNNNILINKYDDFNDAFNNIPKYLHRNIRIKYKNYYGFTFSNDIRNNDIYSGYEIFFSKKCHCEIDFNISLNFSKIVESSSWPPHKNQLICGIVEKGEKGLFFRKWFPCSKQFLLLWTLIVFPNHPCFFIDNKLKSNDKIYSELDTDSLFSQMQNGFKIFNVESTLSNPNNIYKKLAKMILDNSNIENIKKSKLNKSNNIINNDSFEENFYDDVLWMVN